MIDYEMQELAKAWVEAACDVDFQGYELLVAGEEDEHGGVVLNSIFYDA